MKREVKDIAASVRARLLNLATTGTYEFQDLLVQYGLERLLYRLSVSEYRDRFVLKGAMLFTVWSPLPHRVTHDLDLLGFGPPDIDDYETVFRSLCTVQVEPDGLVYQPETVSDARIRSVLQTAIEATLARRQTPIPKESPESLRPEFAQDAQKQQQWRAFLGKTRLLADTGDLAAIIAALRDFLLPVLTAIAQDREFNMVWKPGAGWQDLM